MTLVIAFTGAIGAVICGDRREIRFYEGGDSETLEYELYNGIIKTDDELMERSRDLGVRIEIKDDKEKVFASGDLLVGVVTSYSADERRQRRMYLAPGRYLIADVVDDQLRVTGTGGSAFLVFGNVVTKKLSNEVISRAKKPKTLSDAVMVLMRAMESVSQRTASVSRAYSVVQTPSLREYPEGVLQDALLQDTRENHWRML
jgi:hypothetical protein